MASDLNSSQEIVVGGVDYSSHMPISTMNAN